uniref:OSJNBb0069N01.14 protein n=1 Tax=Oryza sativa subsp. japonica TaxID=39947 RepID=Q7XRF9_ORYSJ|nr:OSJNBb0069N01.14 [Oryza sativa Japonica Group]
MAHRSATPPDIRRQRLAPRRASDSGSPSTASSRELGAGDPRQAMVGRRRQPGHHYPAVAGCGWPFHRHWGFVVSLQNVRWPPKFRPNLTEKYDGSINPSEFLQIYTTIITAGTYPRLGEEAELHTVQWKDDESLRSYIQRFCQVRNTIPCIPAHAVVYAFRNGVRHNRMLEKIASKEPMTTAELFELADKEKATGDKPSSTAPSGEGRSADKWCSVHNTYRHSLADCRSVKNLAERFRKADEEKRQSRWEGKAPATPANDRRGEAKKKAPADDGDDSKDLEFQIHQGTVATLDGGACAHTSRRGFKTMRRELLAAVPTHEAARKARWSEVKLTFDQSDHPTVLTRGGKLALVVSPTIHNVKMKRVLVDEGASLSIISPATFDALKAPGMKLQPSLPIIGVTPGHRWPLGHVELPLTFGDSTNFRTERIDFDVADLNLPYNAVLGRPSLVKFMAAYLQMKMPGPSDPITVFDDVKVALACAEQRADNLVAATEPQPSESSASRASKKRLASADEVPVKDISLGDDPSKTAKIDGPTFQRMTRITLSNQIGRNVEAYVDDLVVKTHHQDTLLQYLAETFDSLRSTRMKLNPEKCVFGVPVMHFDGSLNLQGAGAGVTLTSPSGDVLKYVVRLDFRATNNMVEYEGLLVGLRAVARVGIRRLIVLGDSQLVVNQVSKEYQCTDPQMDAYVREVRRMERHFDGLELRHIPRRDNAVADELLHIASA